jgi:hypothetical protein
VGCFVYNKPKVKFIRFSNHIDHYGKYLYYLMRTKRDPASAYCIFNWNTSVSDQKWRLPFPAESAKVNDKPLSHYQYFASGRRTEDSQLQQHSFFPSQIVQTLSWAHPASCTVLGIRNNAARAQR